MERYLRGISRLGGNGDEVEHRIGPPFERAADGYVECFFIVHFRAVEADDHERPTIDDVRDLCCAWASAQCAGRSGDGVAGQALAIELSIPDRERECHEVRTLVADVIALPAD